MRGEVGPAPLLLALALLLVPPISQAKGSLGKTVHRAGGEGEKGLGTGGQSNQLPTRAPQLDVPRATECGGKHLVSQSRGQNGVRFGAASGLSVGRGGFLDLPFL